ncbi:MAG: hypothetical protein U1F16_04455 [Turneriella sp.]
MPFWACRCLKLKSSPSASYVILGEGKSQNLSYTGLEAALSDPQVSIRLFSKPEIDGACGLG